MKTQKTNRRILDIILVITVILGLPVNFLFAINPIESLHIIHFPTCIPCVNKAPVMLFAPATSEKATLSDEAPPAERSLAPTTPMEADFSDEIPSYSGTGLAPATPMEADFNDEVPSSSGTGLAPATPSEASFEDDPGSITVPDIERLAPTTPAEADFND